MKRLKKVKRRSSDKVFYSVVTVFLALLGLVVLYPLIYVVSCSFSSAHALNGGKVQLVSRAAASTNTDAINEVRPITDYTASGTVITLPSAPESIASFTALTVGENLS